MMSLRNRVIAIVILASLFMVVAISITAYQSLGQDQRDLIVEQEGKLRAPPELENQIHNQSHLERFFPGGVVVFDAQDTAVAEHIHVPGRIGTNYADRPHFKRMHRSGAPIISKPIMSRTTDVPQLSFLVPIHHQGRILGSVGGIIKLGQESILPARAERQDTRTGTLSLIIDADNRLYIESPDATPEEELQPLPSAGDNALIDGILANTSGSAVIDYQGKRYLLATDSVERLNWVFARAVPYELAMAPIRASFRQFFAISAAVTLMLLVLAWLAAGIWIRAVSGSIPVSRHHPQAPESTGVTHDNVSFP